MIPTEQNGIAFAAVFNSESTGRHDTAARSIYCANFHPPIALCKSSRVVSGGVCSTNGCMNFLLQWPPQSL
jgi:hypothetical protein